MIAIVGCSATKGTRRAPACDLYTSQLFRLARRYAEKHADRWYIASALHGIIEHDAPIDPYEKKLSAREAKAWAARAAKQLADLENLDGTEVEILAGSLYATPLRAELVKRGALVREPLAGMQIGERLQFLTRQNPARVSLTKADRDPAGGLTASGRAKYRAAGAHLRAGVQTVRTSEDARRKGSFLRRMYGRKEIPPLADAHGRPTRYALQAQAWGERAPRTKAEVRALAAEGSALLDRARADNPRRTPKLTRTPPSYEPLMRDGKMNPELRARVLDLPAAVYVLRRIGNERPEYVGSSLPGQNDAAAATQARRVWKTILRHFHARRTTGRSKSGKRAYSFGRDNWTASDPENYEVAVLACSPVDVRELELQAQDAYQPRHLPPDYESPAERAAQRQRELDEVPF